MAVPEPQEVLLEFSKGAVCAASLKNRYPGEFKFGEPGGVIMLYGLEDKQSITDPPADME